MPEGAGTKMKTTRNGKIKIVKSKAIDLNDDDLNADIAQKTKKLRKKKKKKKRAGSKSVNS